MAKNIFSGAAAGKNFSGKSFSCTGKYCNFVLHTVLLQ